MSIIDRRARRKNERGFVTVEVVVAFAFSLIIFTGFTNLILIQYGRGIIRAAADESARTGAQVADGDDTKNTKSLLACKQRQADVLEGLGTFGKVSSTSCTVVNGRVVSSVSASFKPWIAGLPTFNESATAFSVKERAPR